MATGGVIRLFVLFLVALLYGVAGYAHLATPAPFIAITPHWVPWPEAVIRWTGIAEMIGAAALLQPVLSWLRQAAAIGLALYALCVWPANFHHFALDMARNDGGWGLAYHIPRLALQPLIIWAPLWASRLVDWPCASRKD